MNNSKRTRSLKRPVKTLSAAVLGTALLLSASASFAFAADTAASGQAEAAAPISAVQPLSDSVRIAFKEVKHSTDQLETELQVPVISGMKDTAYQNALNANLAARAKAVVDVITKQAAADYASNDGSYVFRPYGVTIKSELISDGSAASDGLLSFRVYSYTYTGGAHGGTVETTYNIRNTEKASPVKLKDLFGPNYKDVVNRAVKAEIASRPDDFFADTFKSIADTQAFYVKNGIAYIVFQQYEIAPYAAGMPEIALVIGGTPAPAGAAALPVTVNGKNVKTAALYAAPGGALMVPLRPIAEALGYKTTYVASSRKVFVVKGGELSFVTAGKNLYASGSTAAFALGSAPVIKNGSYYVPIDFFAKVLNAGVSYTKQAIVLVTAK
jgi:Copper amine oxidase N-terminal domain/Deacetylase PdaC/Protein of unknown function (DUF3298)